ncbi:MAG: hypothetical protein R6V03_05750 [Kiritimatiellia bacterium]
MVRKHSEYTRLPGGPGGLNIVRHTLWMGRDHFLLVTHAVASQCYKRFYFKDIQAVVVSQTGHYRLYAAILAGFSALSGAVLLVTLIARSPIGFFFASIPTVILLAALIRNRVLGPTAKALMRTGVQTVDLPSLSRMRYASRALVTMSKAVESVQGSVTAEGLSAQAERAASPYAKGEQSILEPADPPRPQPEPPRYCAGKAHFALFVLSVAASIISLFCLLTGVMPVHAFAFAGLFIFFVFVGISSVVTQKNTTMPARLKTTAWTGFIYNSAAQAVSGVVCGIMLMMRMFHQLGAPFPAPGIHSELSSAWFSINAFVSGVIGTFGLRLLARYRRSERRGE